MAALCMVATWVVSLASLAAGHEHGTVRAAEDSGCPSPLAPPGASRLLGTFDREALFLRDASCGLQWSHVQNMHMLSYGVGGVLAALFGQVLPNPFPAPFSIQLLVTAAVAIWKGSILPACTLIASKCLL